MLKRHATVDEALAGKVAAGAPSAWHVMRACLERALKRIPATRSAEHSRDSVLLDVAVALRAGDCRRAEELLAPFRSMLACDAAYLNLCGVICELQGQARCAKRFYGLARGLNPAFKPAERNLRRLYELNAFGRTAERVQLGDVDLRAQRIVPPREA